MPVPEIPSPDPAAPRLARSMRIARGLQLDRAVLYVMFTRLWQLLAGPVTILLIARYFTPEMQGFYYAFGSLIAFQTLFDLNVTVVLLVSAGREWTRLGLDSSGRVAGESSAGERLAGLARFGDLWYRGAALICLLVVGGAGLAIFRGQGLSRTDQLAWCATIAASCGVLTLLPRMAILQGCHQVLAVNRNLTWQSICGSLVIWTCLIGGLGLWAVPLSWLSRLAWDAWLVWGRYRKLFQSLTRYPRRAIGWKSEIWPLQWRLAIQGVASTLVTGSFVLALMEMHSESAAGRMGMSLAVLQMLLWGALGWMQTRVPILAGHAKRHECSDYDRLFGRMTLVTSAAVIAGACGGLVLLIALDWFDVRIGSVPLAGRFIDPVYFALMAGAIVAWHVLNCLVIYSRIRQREPFVVPHVLLHGGLAASIWVVAGPLGSAGVAVVTALAFAFVGVPVWLAIWFRERRAWPVEDRG